MEASKIAKEFSGVLVMVGGWIVTVPWAEGVIMESLGSVAMIAGAGLAARQFGRKRNGINR